MMRNYDEEKCHWESERGRERKKGHRGRSEIIMEATSPRAYCSVQNEACRLYRCTQCQLLACWGLCVAGGREI